MEEVSQEKKDEIIAKVNSFIGEGESHCLDKHKRIQENRKYERGEQWSKGDMERQAQRERPAIPHNSIIKIINAIANREIVARFEARVYGRDKSDNGISNVLDEACRWQRDQTETEHEESQAVRSMVGSGYGVMHMYWDANAANGDGRICDEELPVEEMLWPVRARRMNLIDRRWHVRGKVIAAAEAEAEFGIESDEAKRFFEKYHAQKKLAHNGIPDTGSSMDSKPARSWGLLGWGTVNNGSAWYSTAEEEIMVAEAEWLEYESVFKVAQPDYFDAVSDLMLGIAPSLDLGQDEQGQPIQLTRDQILEMDPEAKQQLFSQLFRQTHIETLETEKLKDFLELYKEVTGEEFSRDLYRRVKREIVKYAIISDRVLWDYGSRPYGCFTYEFLTGWRVEGEDGIDFYGVIDVAKGPQDFKNAILGNMLSTYMTSPKGQLLIEDDLIPNPGVFTDQFARPVGVAMVPPGFVQQKDVKWTALPAPNFPVMQPTLLQIAYQGVEELFGLSSVDLGTQQDLRRVSGTTVQAAKTASNTIVASLFDSIRRFRKRYGSLSLRFVTKHYSPQEMIRIVGEDKAEDIAGINEWGDTLRYDIKVEEAPTSPTERMELLERLQQVGSLDKWRERQDITFDEMLDLIPHIPESFKRDVKQRENKDQQISDEMQQKDQQIQSMGIIVNSLFEFVAAQPGGDQIIQEFQANQQFAQGIAQQLAANMTGQPADGSGQPMPDEAPPSF